MLDKIKSLFILKKIFNKLSEVIKLNSIVHNKKLQNKLNIEIIDYRRISGRYIIGERNGKGKEYDSYNDKLIYEGEYLNGKKNGKGKEYDRFDRLIFEGEYINGKKWNGKGMLSKYELKNGKGFMIEYDKVFNICIIKFEGEYLNGKRNGRGKEYDEDDHLLYEGEYLNGKRNGKGKEYNTFIDKLTFEGEYLNGKKWNGKIYTNIITEIKNGKGYIKEYLTNFTSCIYEGNYTEGQRNGIGKIYFYKYLIFTGEFKNGELNGEVKEYDLCGNLNFEGIYLYNYKRKGKIYCDGYLEYEGEYLYDRKWNGKGFDENGNIIYELNNGNGKVKEYNLYDEFLYEGEYLGGKKNGKGKEYDKYDTLIFEGEYLNGKRSGNGKEYDDEGKLKFEGEYLNGERNGKGKEYNKYNTLIFEGEYLNGKKSGNGKEFNRENIYETEFKNDKFEEYGIFYFFDRYKGGTFKDGFDIFYSSLGFEYKRYYKNVLSTKILVIIYKILLFLYCLYSKIMKNKLTLFFIIILILGILIN